MWQICLKLSSLVSCDTLPHCLGLSIDCRNEAIPDWLRAPMAAAVAQDDKGKGRLNEPTFIKQEHEDSDHDAQVGLQFVSGLLAASYSSVSAQAFLLFPVVRRSCGCRSSQKMAWHTSLVAQGVERM